MLLLAIISATESFEPTTGEHKLGQDMMDSSKSESMVGNVVQNGAKFTASMVIAADCKHISSIYQSAGDIKLIF